MTRWEERPVEVANLLNPAFCGHVIYTCAEAFLEEAAVPMPYPLAFLILPLALHPETRATLNPRTRHFEVWLNMSPEVKVGLAGRARTLVSFTREALGFLHRSGVVTIRETDAALVGGRDLKRMRREFPIGDDTKECIAKAAVLGKLFGRTNSTPTIYAALGLRP